MVLERYSARGKEEKERKRAKEQTMKSIRNSLVSVSNLYFGEVNRNLPLYGVWPTTQISHFTKLNQNIWKNFKIYHPKVNLV